MTRLSHHTLSQLDFTQALKEEIEWQSDLIPKQVIDLALSGDGVDAADYADYIEGLTTTGTHAPRADLINAIKWRNGRRPVHVMPIHERTLYRAVVNLLNEDLPPMDRSSEAYESFDLAPTRESDAQFVIKTDIANYFSSIDHELMSEEIVSRTGRSEISSYLCEFWRSMLNRSVGIPQMSEPSKVLSELLVDNLHRRLIRKGFRVWRYADDFRIAARSRQESIAALDAIHEESRRMGLCLNDWKTHLLSMDKYNQFINEDKAKEEDARASALHSLMSWNPYIDEVEIPGEDEVYVEAAEALLREWRDEVADAIIEHSGLLQRHKLIRNALSVLETFKEGIGLQFLQDILLREPQLTPAVFRYVRALGSALPDTAASVCSKIAQSGILNRWQQLWLAWSLQTADFAANRAVENSTDLRHSLNSLLQDSSEIVRGQACLTLAINGSLGKADWAAVYESCTTLGSPYSAAALPGVRGIEEVERKRLSPTSKLDIVAMHWGAGCIASK
ncbi:reverse transcriptase domain-containing protein [Streptomyces canus]|uniref:reverse transcriptase domain-containing protein n=1 Tax=Streptomyces canus TaxID=58343 RepID=UPI0037117330